MEGVIQIKSSIAYQKTIGIVIHRLPMWATTFKNRAFLASVLRRDTREECTNKMEVRTRR